MTLKDILLRIADGDQNVKDWNYRHGLCSNIACIMKIGAMQAESMVRDWAKDWPHAAQPYAYPVPYTAEELKQAMIEHPHWTYKTACCAVYDHNSIKGTLYSDSHYGKMRRDLARHIAERL